MPLIQYQSVIEALVNVKVVKAAVLFSLLSSTVTADVLSVHCPLGCPSNPANNDLVFRHLYAFSNNAETKFADWVAYEVDVANFGDTPGRKWAADPLLDQNATLEAGDYKGASKSALQADRGHQAPLASFAGSRHWSELNYLSNITPQDKDLNQGSWKNLEEAVRKAVGFRNSLYVITGPIYTDTMVAMPGADETHKVPSAYFKIVYDDSGNTSAFIMQQDAKRNDGYCDKSVNLDQIGASVSFQLPKRLKPSAKIASRLGCTS